jgi:hypothetical protein
MLMASTSLPHRTELSTAVVESFVIETTDDFPFALTLSMFKFLTFEATYRVWNIWVYLDVIKANAGGSWYVRCVERDQKGV